MGTITTTKRVDIQPDLLSRIADDLSAHVEADRVYAVLERNGVFMLAAMHDELVALENELREREADAQYRITTREARDGHGSAVYTRGVLHATGRIKGAMSAIIHDWTGRCPAEDVLARDWFEQRNGGRR